LQPGSCGKTEDDSGYPGGGTVSAKSNAFNILTGITLVTSQVCPVRNKLKLNERLTMRQRLPFFLLACAMVAIVLRASFSWAQQAEPDVVRKVVSRVAPSYPDLARRLNLHGIVKLVVVIAPDGSVKSTEVMGGNPVLTQAAVDAVRKWRYEAASEQTHGVVELRFDSH
jgi:TonB family protein